MVDFEFIWQESHTFVLSIFLFLFFLCAVVVKKINENPKAIFPLDLGKLHSRWPEPDKGISGFFCIVLFMFVFFKRFSFLIFLFLFFYIIKQTNKNNPTLLQSRFTNIITDSLGAMEQVSHVVFYPFPNVLERRKLPRSRGVMDLLQGTKCAFYDTAGQREFLSSGQGCNLAAWRLTITEIHHRMCPFKKGFPTIVVVYPI